MIRPMPARVAPAALTNSKPKYKNPFSRRDFFLNNNLKIVNLLRFVPCVFYQAYPRKEK